MDQAKSQAPSYAGHIHRDVTRRDGDLTITLEFEARFLRRKRMATDCGMAFMVDLAETVSLDAGDAFLLMMGARLLSRQRPSRWWKYAIKILQKLLGISAIGTPHARLGRTVLLSAAIMF